MKDLYSLDLNSNESFVEQKTAILKNESDSNIKSVNFIVTDLGDFHKSKETLQSFMKFARLNIFTSNDLYNKKIILPCVFLYNVDEQEIKVLSDMFDKVGAGYNFVEEKLIF